ncbi:CapA family protein [Pseudonocardia sp. DLS-67]
MTKTENLTIMGVGDLIVREPDPAALFALCRDTLHAADVVVGQVEIPHTDRGVEQLVNIPTPPAPVAHLSAFVDMGLTVATLAGNHTYDSGEPGVVDTVEGLRALGIATCGAGTDLDAARRPAVVERSGARVGVLSYNTVGPRESWASATKAGCAYVHVLSHYELDHPSPGGPPTAYSACVPPSLDRMQSDIRALREDVDVLVVALHKGVGHWRAHIAMYEPQVSRAAIDAGADVVLGHHAHIMRGIEIYHGKPIYHGLGNFATASRTLADRTSGASAATQEWARRRKQLFGFDLDPSMPAYPWHPESRNTAIAHCRFDATGNIVAGFVPCYIDDHLRPEPLGPGAGDAVVDYIRQIGEEAGLSTTFEWDGDVVVVGAG